ncbi:MAG: energy transducer TonB [Bacteroidota bacterium]
MKKLLILLFIPITFSLNAQDDLLISPIEISPEYPGGVEALKSFIANEIKYPLVANKAGVSGTVFVTFVVDKSGEVRDAEVLRGIGGGCDEEALRVVGLMEKWNPGTQRGKAVHVQYNIPIKFALEQKKSKESIDH